MLPIMFSWKKNGPERQKTFAFDEPSHVLTCHRGWGILCPKCKHYFYWLCHQYEMWPHHWKLDPFFNFCTLKFLLYSNIELLALFSLLSVFKTWMSWNLYGVVSKRFPTTCQSVVRGTWASIDALLTNFLGLHTNISHIWLISSNTRGHPDPFALHRHPSLKFLCQFKSAFQLAHLYWIFLKMHFAHSCLTVIEHILIHKMPLHFYGTSFFTWKQKKNKNSFDTFW